MNQYRFGPFCGWQCTRSNTGQTPCFRAGDQGGIERIIIYSRMYDKTSYAILPCEV